MSAAPEVLEANGSTLSSGDDGARLSDWVVSRARNCRSDAGSELQNRRQAALERFCQAGFPTTKDEDWKYTSLRPLLEAGFSMAEVRGLPDQVPGTPLDHMLQLRIDVVGESVHIPSHQIAGLTISTLANLTGEMEPLKSRLGSIGPIDTNSLADANLAACRDAVVIHVNRDAVVETPIHIATRLADRAISMPRVMVILERGAKAHLIESYWSLGEAHSWCNSVVEVEVGELASLEHVKLQAQANSSFHTSVTNVNQGTASQYNSYNVTLGGRLTRNDLNVLLTGEDIHCRLDGVVALNGEQHADNHTRLDHAFPHCDSFEVYKHVLDGTSHGVFNGKIYVHQDAQKTDAKQTNQTLLLSPQATMNSKPQLEIFADDVKCTHGATVGQVRQEALFYLRSRGIPLHQARAVLVYAFAAEVVEKISSAEVRDAVEAMLFEKLGGR